MYQGSVFHRRVLCTVHNTSVETLIIIHFPCYDRKYIRGQLVIDSIGWDLSSPDVYVLPKTITSLCFIIVIYNKNYKLFNITHIVQYEGEHTGAEVTVFAEFFTPARSIQSGQRRRRYERFFHRNRARAPFAGRRKIIMGKKKKKIRPGVRTTINMRKPLRWASCLSSSSPVNRVVDSTIHPRPNGSEK